MKHKVKRGTAGAEFTAPSRKSNESVNLAEKELLL
jgi:hypothetical protein